MASVMARAPEASADVAGIRPLPQAWASEIDTILRADRVPGAAITVITPQTSYEHYFGERRYGTDGPVGPHSGFQLCSLTKAYVSTLFVRLADLGQADLDQPVRQLIPEFAPTPAWLGDEISYRDLLSNRLGFIRGGLSDFGLCSGHDYPELARRFSAMRRAGAFRATYGYCNPGFSLSVLGLERSSGRSFADLLDEYILGPAGLKETTLGPKARARPDRAFAHTIDRASMLVQVDEDDDWARPGAGGILSSARDQRRWMALNLAKGQLDGCRVLPANLWDELWKPHVFIDPAQREMAVGDERARFIAYGLGWHLSTYRDRFMAVHTGGGLGWRTRTVLLPDDGIGLSILLNVDGKTGNVLQQRLLERCLRLPAKPWVEIVRRDRADKLDRVVRALETDFPSSREHDLHADAWVGRYINPESGAAEVTSESGILNLRLPDGPLYDGQLRPLGGSTYEVQMTSPLATFDGPTAPLPRIRFVIDALGVERLLHSSMGEFVRC